MRAPGSVPWLVVVRTWRMHTPPSSVGHTLLNAAKAQGVGGRLRPLPSPAPGGAAFRLQSAGRPGVPWRAHTTLRILPQAGGSTMVVRFAAAPSERFLANALVLLLLAIAAVGVLANIVTQTLRPFPLAPLGLSAVVVGTSALRFRLDVRRSERWLMRALRDVLAP